MKKFIITILALFLLAFGVAGADFYTKFDFSYTAETPASVYVTGGECADTGCTALTNRGEEFFNGEEALTCWNTYSPSGNSNGFNACMNNARITNGVANNVSVVVKQTVPSSFGYSTFFFTEDDGYLVKYYRHENYECDFDICFDTTPVDMEFEKKPVAIAEVGQLNIKNIDDERKPVQVEVPVSIEETVCSAFRFTNPDMYRPEPPVGYSDYSANTQIDLFIRNAVTSTQYLHQTITLPIEADDCAALAAFSWTPDSSLENTAVTFRVETDVIDNQVVLSTMDWAEDTETIYPIDLDGSCWVRGYDFTLSNVDEFTLSPSVAQITQGETLYSLFRGVAYRDNAITPMQFDYRLTFDGTTLVGPVTVGPYASLHEFSRDITSTIAGLDPGSYTVKLIMNPVGSGCTIREPVELTQNLQILAPDLYEARFVVRDSEASLLSGASIVLTLVDAMDYYAVDPVYTETLTTNAQGVVVFDDLIAGDYSYVVSKAGYTSVTKDSQRIASNTIIHVTLPEGNVLPVVDLPANFTADYRETIEIDLNDFVTDFNDGFDALVLGAEATSGNFDVERVGDRLFLSTDAPTTGVLRVSARDPHNAITFDSANIYFIDNTAPEIVEFFATPDDGAAPLFTTFSVNVLDIEGDATCSLDFDDNSADMIDVVCDGLDGLTHTYTTPGTYNVVLSVDDGVNDVVEEEFTIYVYQFVSPNPHVDFFTVESSNGIIVPTNLTFAWSVSHNRGWAVDCRLRILLANESSAVDVPVACDDTYELENFDLTGTSRFTIIGVDNESNQAMQTIDITLFNSSDVILDLNDAELVVEPILFPGEFDFKLRINREVLDMRTIEITPVILYAGTENYLDNGNRKLSSSAVSGIYNGFNEYSFKADIDDFKLNVPTGERVLFEVRLTDIYGTDLVLNKFVTFNYPSAPEMTTSIRGKGTDVIDYMKDVALNGFSTGYNAVEFTAVNNEGTGKRISVSMVSADLGIDLREEISLGPETSRTISLPVYIKEGTEPGKYPVRFAVNDGEDKQVRYSFIVVN